MRGRCLMDLGLAGKTAFVAGSSRGIGRATALAFLREDASVTITGRDADSLHEFEQTIEREFGLDRVLACQGDLSDPSLAAQALERTSDRFGRLDCLVLNAGSGSGERGAQLGRGEWDRVYTENLWISVELAQAALPRLSESGGSVVMIASVAGLENLGAPIPYATAKAALIHYANELARLVAADGVRVNAVAPGNVLFPGGNWDRMTTSDPARWRSFLEREVPLQRFGTPEEIADAVVFLASGRSSFTTGACLVVDGGQTRRP
jgi:3-oxoacyl-[acyl-carrier protein] reductase